MQTGKDSSGGGAKLPLKNSVCKADCYTGFEEVTNAFSHGVGALLALAGSVVLVVLAALQGDPWRIVSFSIYGTTLVVLYLASTLYHAINHPRAKTFFHVMDHVSIFLLIAGSYTPVTLINMRGVWGWAIFGMVWTIALAGVILKVFFTGRHALISVFLYVGMGWLIIVAIHPLLVSMHLRGVALMAAGGVFYTAGLIFYAMKKMRYHHAVWHIFVMAGSATQYLGFLLYVLPEI